jgi:hypothetical protein
MGPLRVVNVSRDQIVGLPGDLPHAFQQAQLIGSSQVKTTPAQRDEILTLFHYGEDPQRPWTAINFEGHLYTYFWSVG